MFDFDELEDTDPVEEGDGVPTSSSATLRAVWWLNLARRPDRRVRHEATLSAAGLAPLAERVEAVDGRGLDLDALDPAIISERAAAEAKYPPPRVVGLHMTCGAIGLMLSWYSLLRRIVQEDAGAECCYLIAEDDAVYCEHFLDELQALLAEVEGFDPQWEALQIGFFGDERQVKPLVHGTAGGAVELERAVQPVWACGTAGILVHGPRGARRLLELLFPARPAQQLDTALSYKYQKLRMYMSKEPLMSADKSHEADTDIQIIPDAPLNDGDLELSMAPDPETTPEVVPEAGRRASGNEKPNGASLRELFACRFLDLRYCFGSPRRTLSSNSTRAS